MVALLMMTAQASAMTFELDRSVDWTVSISSRPYTLDIKGYRQLDGDDSKGVAIFGDDLYFHFDCFKVGQSEKFASRFGSRDFDNTVHVYVFEGMTRITPLNTDDGRKFYLLMTETGGGGSLKVIGERNGQWFQYFDTLDVKRSKQIGWDYYLQNVYTLGDSINFSYEQSETKKYCTLRYKWDEAAQSFNFSIVSG